MSKERAYSPNSGQFKKGSTPWNKGTGKGGRKDIRKGIQGFQPKKVIAINPDGSVYKRFDSVKSAVLFFGFSNRHPVISACQGKSFCRGLKLMYEEDFVPWADYRYRRPRGRDIYGRLEAGNGLCYSFRKPSEEYIKVKREKMRELSLRMSRDPNSAWGKGSKLKPVICIETGERFPSFVAASEKFGVKSSEISMAIKRGGKCHGHTFKKDNK